MSKINNRDELFDYLKGFSIVLVVLGHSIQNGLNNTYETNPVFKFIYSFHMPLFMFISGYVSFVNQDNSIKKLVQKFNSLIIPFWVWFMVSLSITFLICKYNNEDTTNIINSIKSILISPDNGLWFLWVLFLNHAVLFLARKINSRSEELYIFLILILINFCWRYFSMDYLGIGLLRWHLLFYLIGYVINKHQYLIGSFINILGIISCLVFPILLLFWTYNGNPKFIDDLELSTGLKTVISLLYNYLVAITGVLAVYIFFKWAMHYRFLFKNTFINLGKLTLEIYCSHLYFFYFVNTKYLLPIQLHILFLFLIGLGGSLLLGYILKKVAIFSFIFYGKRKYNLQH